jgi:hypothetical protein
MSGYRHQCWCYRARLATTKAQRSWRQRKCADRKASRSRVPVLLVAGRSAGGSHHGTVAVAKVDCLGAGRAGTNVDFRDLGHGFPGITRLWTRPLGFAEIRF